MYFNKEVMQLTTDILKRAEERGMDEAFFKQGLLLCHMQADPFERSSQDDSDNSLKAILLEAILP